MKPCKWQVHIIIMVQLIEHSTVVVIHICMIYLVVIIMNILNSKFLFFGNISLKMIFLDIIIIDIIIRMNIINNNHNSRIRHVQQIKLLNVVIHRQYQVDNKNNK
jgi:hypothetical protein